MRRQPAPSSRRRSTARSSRGRRGRELPQLLVGVRARPMRSTAGRDASAPSSRGHGGQPHHPGQSRCTSDRDRPRPTEPDGGRRDAVVIMGGQQPPTSSASELGRVGRPWLPCCLQAPGCGPSCRCPRQVQPIFRSRLCAATTTGESTSNGVPRGGANAPSRTNQVHTAPRTDQ